MHQKMLLVDGHHAYLGSANMDWKSFSQVMEIGILVESSQAIVQDMQNLFDLWWVWSDPALQWTPNYQPVEVFSERFQCMLRLPPWSDGVPTGLQQPNPFVTNHSLLVSSFNKDNQINVMLSGERSQVFITAAPIAATALSRTFDEDGLIYTILQAKKTVCLSVMDFVPFATYPQMSHPEGSIYWPALTDAILAVIFARNVAVRLLISYWAHTSASMVVALNALMYQAAAVRVRS
jgi:phospholipase D3/4